MPARGSVQGIRTQWPPARHSRSGPQLVGVHGALHRLLSQTRPTPHWGSAWHTAGIVGAAGAGGAPATEGVGDGAPGTAGDEAVGEGAAPGAAVGADAGGGGAPGDAGDGTGTGEGEGDAVGDGGTGDAVGAADGGTGEAVGPVVGDPVGVVATVGAMVTGGGGGV